MKHVGYVGQISFTAYESIRNYKISFLCKSIDKIGCYGSRKLSRTYKEKRRKDVRTKIIQPLFCISLKLLNHRYVHNFEIQPLLLKNKLTFFYHRQHFSTSQRKMYNEKKKKKKKENK